MAKSTSWGFTNTSDNTHKTIAPTILNEDTEYAIIEDEAGVTVLANLSSPVDQGERVSIKAQVLDKVTLSNVKNAYPAPVQQGIQYSIKIESLLSTTDSAAPGYRIDEPICATLTFKHALSANITPEHIDTIIKRVLGAIYKADGSSRVASLMRLATKPEEN